MISSTTNSALAFAGLTLVNANYVKLDIINIYVFSKKQKVSCDDADVLLEVGWKFIGNGFTTLKPEKLQKKISKLVEKKTYRKYAEKNFTNVDDELDLMKLPSTMLLLKFYKYIANIWTSGDKKELKKLNKEKFNQAMLWFKQ